ncbi:uncharacterized protein LOC144744812 [Ciona intestinalis]
MLTIKQQYSCFFFRCHCLAGYSGSHCEEIIPVCDSAPCNNNGTCIENSLNHTLFDCLCVANYTGDFCEVAPTPLETIDPDKDDFPLALVLTCLFLFIILSSIFLIFKYHGKKKPLSIAPTPPPEEKSLETIETPIQELQESEESQKVKTPEPQESINSEPEPPKPETPKLEPPKLEPPKLEPPKPELPRTNTEIKFSDMSIPPSETIAHVTPMDHNTVSSSPDVSIEPEKSANVKKVSEFQNKISENFDDPFKSISPLPKSSSVVAPPLPPCGPTDEVEEKSNIRKSVLPAPRTRFDSQTLSRLSEISLYNFYNSRRSSVHPLGASPERDSTLSSGGCALRDSRRTPVLGVPTRDSKLLITESRTAEEEFEMESRKGSMVGRSNFVRASIFSASKT